ncbi:hypothetical protein [uncultured Cohaesibacter sp.]|uniref:hypothetical protein n=1 Tax=uncultured Cohaesibacter sp. TaxID=1002546 RepID=UPI00292F7128|nr:hypothetical protein [uncultured Cohaesibacter sp.]
MRKSMKVRIMEAISAVVLNKDVLEEMLERAGQRGAELAVAQFKEQLEQDPQDRHVMRLREFLLDRSSVELPREVWASSHHIRRIELSPKGKPKSNTWMQHFKRESGLEGCTSRPSPSHGRLREWCFEDIANAWERFYAFKW